MLLLLLIDLEKRRSKPGRGTTPMGAPISSNGQTQLGCLYKLHTYINQYNLRPYTDINQKLYILHLLVPFKSINGMSYYEIRNS